MKEWILCIAGTQLLCFVVSLFLEGTKYEGVASKVCGISLVLALCFPLFSLSGNGINGDWSLKGDFSVDTNAVQSMNAYKINLIKTEVSKVLSQHGIDEADIAFETSGDFSGMVIEKIIISLEKSVYYTNQNNIHKVKKSLREVVNVSDERIVIQPENT